MLEQLQCVACGKELTHFGPGTSPERCEDCIPQTGPGSFIQEQIVANLRRLRLDAGLSVGALAERAAARASDLSQFERGVAGEPGVVKALRLAHSLGVSIDALTERVYWDRGEIAPRPGRRRSPLERFSGFFQVLPPNVPVFEPAPSRLITSREEVAQIVGQNVRSVRERRHQTQVELADAADLSKSGLSLIERGVRETTLGTLLSIARSLEVTPGFLFGGLAWRPQSGRPAECGGAHRHSGGDLDGPIKRLWEEGRTARQIGDALGIPTGSVSVIVHRLRERGAGLGHRRRPTTPSQRQARHRRQHCQSAREVRRVHEPDAGDPRLRVSRADIGARISSNLEFRRLRAGLTFRQLGEATETDHTVLYRIEKSGHTPQLSLIVKLAGSLNVRCESITSGIAWEPTAQAFFLMNSDLDDKRPAAALLGQNVLRARRQIGLSQQALADRTSVCRSDVVDFERGKRNFRLCAVAKLAGALEVELDELFSGVVDWYVRPLPAPEYAHGDRPPSKAERDAQLVRLWREGKPERAIAEALDLSVAAVGPYVRELRDTGHHLSYRRPPRSLVERSARQRRRACFAHRQGSKS